MIFFCFSRFFLLLSLVFLVFGFLCFFFSSRRRHTRCALVTGVQTCALPIWEVSARARAAELGRSYLALNATGRHRFLSLLAEEFGPDREQVAAAVEALGKADGEEARRGAERGLRKALEPRWRRLLTRFNALPEGVKFLVDLRAELLSMAKDSAELSDLNSDLRELLAAWFDVGLLELRQIT